MSLCPSEEARSFQNHPVVAQHKVTPAQDIYAGIVLRTQAAKVTYEDMEKERSTGGILCSFRVYFHPMLDTTLCP